MLIKTGKDFAVCEKAYMLVRLTLKCNGNNDCIVPHTLIKNRHFVQDMIMRQNLH